MRKLGPLFFLTMAFSLTSAQTVKEFNSSFGVARVTVVPESSTPGDSVVPGPVLIAIPGLGVQGDALLEIYFLDSGDGRELKFPIKYSQLAAYEQSHGNGKPGLSVEDRAVGFIRDFSQELSIHMKEPDLTGGKK